MLFVRKIYGYCRVSSSRQNIDRQERNILKEYPAAIIVKETFTGTKYQGMKRLKRIVDIVQAGDMIVFDSVSRMSRNAEDGFKLYQELYNREVELVFLKEHHIDTATYHSEMQKRIDVSIISGDTSADELMGNIISALNKYIMELAQKQIRLAFQQSQKEVEDLHQRTREGIETARRNGKQIGQQTGRKLIIKKKEPVQQLILKHSRSFNGTLKDADVMSVINGTPDLHVSHNTYQKYKRELRLSSLYE